MALRDVNVKKEYRSFHDDIIHDFYIPILQQSTLYRRAVGFFSSSALVEISRGINSLIQSDGTIQIVASPQTGYA